MPELPDLTVYIHALNTRVAGRRLVGVRLISPFVLRSVNPPLEAIKGRTVQAIFRVGKRIVVALAAPTASPSSTTSSTVEDELFLVVHLMIAGRLRWREPHQKPGVGPRMILAAFEFEHGTLLFTEAGSKKRASLHLVRGRRGVEALNRGGVEPLEVSLTQFRESLTRESHTLKRTLTDPHLFSGIGNAYSDEILHAARLSPLKLSRTLSDDESFGCTRPRARR